ncbi:hypothetical protein Tco_1403099 [Tanacetum coccineum]
MFNDVKLQVDYECEMAFKLLRLKLEILKKNIKFRGGLLGLKVFLKLLLAVKEVIKNGNAHPITKLVEDVETIITPSTAEEKAQRRLELKARSTLLMGIPNEHQLKFNLIRDAKSLL